MGVNPCSKVPTSGGKPGTREVEAVIAAYEYMVLDSHVQLSHMIGMLVVQILLAM